MAPKELLPTVLLLAVMPIVAQGQFNYITNAGGTITITGYTGAAGEVTIPDMITGLPVTAIVSGAFDWNDSLTSAIIPNSVTSIGDFAFYVCLNLTNVTIPNSVTSIGNYAFANCYSLTELTIPDSVTSVGNDAFYACIALTSITIPSTVISIGNSAFYACINLTSITIPESVNSIGNCAFCICHSMTAITVDALNSVYSSVDGVLFNKNQTTLIQCPGAKAGSYKVPNSVTYIGDYAFWDCINLTGITIPNSVTSTGRGAFANCNNLAGAYFKGNAPSFECALGECPFLGAPATVYYLPGTSGWGATFGGRRTSPWVLPNPVILTTAPNFGVGTNDFGFVISWATNVQVVVEASTNLASPLWIPLATNTLTSGSSYFSDPEWTNYAARSYRVRSP